MEDSKRMIMENKTSTLAELNKFVGEWHTEGIMLGGGKGPDVRIKGTDIYEWLPGGFFLMHKVDVQIGEERNQTLEIIGYDKAAKHYSMHYFDNRGNAGKMVATFHEGVWTFGNDQLQFTGRFNEANNSISGRWEKRGDNDTWQPFITIKLQKKPNARTASHSA